MPVISKLAVIAAAAVVSAAPVNLTAAAAPNGGYGPTVGKFTFVNNCPTPVVLEGWLCKVPTGQAMTIGGSWDGKPADTSPVLKKQWDALPDCTNVNPRRDGYSAGGDPHWPDPDPAKKDPEPRLGPKLNRIEYFSTTDPNAMSAIELTGDWAGPGTPDPLGNVNIISHAGFSNSQKFEAFKPGTEELVCLDAGLVSTVSDFTIDASGQAACGVNTKPHFPGCLSSNGGLCQPAVDMGPSVGSRDGCQIGWWSDYITSHQWALTRRKSGQTQKCRSVAGTLPPDCKKEFYDTDHCIQSLSGHWHRKCGPNAPEYGTVGPTAVVQCQMKDYAGTDKVIPSGLQPSGLFLDQSCKPVREAYPQGVDLVVTACGMEDPSPAGEEPDYDICHCGQPDKLPNNGGVVAAACSGEFLI